MAIDSDSWSPVIEDRRAHTHTHMCSVHVWLKTCIACAALGAAPPQVMRQSRMVSVPASAYTTQFG